MNKLINIILSGLLWRQYKFLIVSLIVLIVGVFIVGKVHDDFLAFAQTSENSNNIGLSFLIKWGVWALLFLAFLLSNHFVNKRKEKQKLANQNNKSLFNIIKTKSSDLLHSNQGAQAGETQSNKQAKETMSEGDENDAFAHLRDKKKLRTYADLVIEKHEDKKD